MTRAKWLLGLAVAAACAGMIGVANPASAGPPGWFTGYLVHVSAENLKVEDTSHTQTLSFLLVPKFKKLYSDDGKLTYQMASLAPGMIVKVLYDQDLLGARHADKIFIVNAEGHALTVVR